MEKIDFSQIKNIIDGDAKNIVVIPHNNPDGDAMGSCLGIKIYLDNKGHNAVVLSPTEYPNFLKWMPKNDEVIIFEKDNQNHLDLIENADVIFAMDYNDLSRINIGDLVGESKAYKVMIDHHQQPSDFPDFTYSDTSVCSTAQMLYQFIDNLNDLDKINSDIATCIYTGILTDTGSFKYDTTTAYTHRIVADLMDKGADNFKISSKLYDSQSIDKLKLQGVALNNLQIVEGSQSAFISLSREELLACNYKKGDSEGLVNMALSVENINFAGIFIEDPETNFIKISLRSKGEFSVNSISRKYFNGGGHINAAGGRLNDTLDNSIKKFKEVALTYKDQIAKSYE